MYTPLRINQAQFVKKPVKTTKKYDFYGKKAVLNGVIAQDPNRYVKGLSKGKMRVLQFLFKFSKTYPGIAYFSHYTIAEKVKLSYGYVGEIMQELEKDGWFVSYQRWNDSKWYKFCTHIKDGSFLTRTLAYLSLAILWSSNAVSREKYDLNTQNGSFISYRNVSVRESISTRATEEKRSKESSMSKIDVLTPAIKGLKNISLTEAGKIKLIAFPEEAILKADLALANHRVAKPMGFFIATCKKYCAAHGIPIEWEKARIALMAHGYDYDSPEIAPRTESLKRESTDPNSFGEYHDKRIEREKRIANASLSLVEKEKARMKSLNQEWRKARFGIDVDIDLERKYVNPEFEAQEWDKYRDPKHPYHDFFKKMQEVNKERFESFAPKPQDIPQPDDYRTAEPYPEEYYEEVLD